MPVHRRPTAPRLALLLAGALALAPARAAEPSATPVAGAPALVARVVAAYGGPTALERARRSLATGRIVSEVLHPGAPGVMARAYERSGRLRVEIAFPDGKGGEVRVLSGGRGWRFGEEVKGPSLAAMVLQAARLDLPALLSAPGTKVAAIGTWSHEGRTLQVLSVTLAPGVAVEAGIDPASGRIVRSRGVAQGTPPLEFVTTYADFRQVEGVLVPFREGNWANGQATGETRLERVEFPESLPPLTFEP